jgi:hypothetical protein
VGERERRRRRAAETEKEEKRERNILYPALWLKWRENPRRGGTREDRERQESQLVIVCVVCRCGTTVDECIVAALTCVFVVNGTS